MAPPLDDPARHAAFTALARQSRLFPEFEPHAIDDTLDAMLAPAQGSEHLRDHAFAHAIYDAAVARYLTLTFLIEHFANRKMESIDPRVQAALLCGSAQLLFLDRVPPHAAINHAVEWVKRTGTPKAAGLVNAVLRRIAELVLPPSSSALPSSATSPNSTSSSTRQIRDRFTFQRDELPLGGTSPGALVLKKDILPEDRIERLCVATSHPRTLVQHWLNTRSISEVEDLCLHTLTDPPTILNVGYARSPLPTTLTPHDLPGSAVFIGSHNELIKLLTERPDLWVQDPASCKAIQSICDLSPRIIIDLCAGQGTKTRQLAAAFPNSDIIATDIDVPRFEKLSKLFHNNAQVKVLPIQQVLTKYVGQADLVLLDVPCSNTGVLPRRPEARYRFGPKTFTSIQSVQKQILADSIVLLRENPRGSILYATCSLEQPENHDQARWAAKWHNFKISRESFSTPQGNPGESPAAYHDGAYSVLLSS